MNEFCLSVLRITGSDGEGSTENICWDVILAEGKTWDARGWLNTLHPWNRSYSTESARFCQQTWPSVQFHPVYSASKYVVKVGLTVI